MPFTSPGAAFGDALTQYLLQQEELKRRAALDELSRRDVESQMQAREENTRALAEQRAALAANTRAQAQGRVRETLAKGPVSPETARMAGLPPESLDTKVTTLPSTSITGSAGFPGVIAPSAKITKQAQPGESTLLYKGTPEMQRMEALGGALKDVTDVQEAGRIALAMGIPPNQIDDLLKGMYRQPRVAVRVSPDKGLLEQLDPATGQWTRIGEIPENAVMLQQPQPPAANAQREIDEADAEATARLLIEHPEDLSSLSRITSFRGNQRMLLFRKLKELDPSYNVGMIDRRIKFLDSYLDPKGRAAINRQSMNNILKHGADLVNINDSYKRANVRFLNTPVNALANQMGEQAFTSYTMTLGVLIDEVSNYFAGGFAPHAEQQKVWQKILDATATPSQIEAFTKTIAHLGLRRASSYNAQFKTTMGFDDPNIIDPDARAAAQKLGMGEEVKRFRTGGHLGPDQPGLVPGWEGVVTDPSNPNWGLPSPKGGGE